MATRRSRFYTSIMAASDTLRARPIHLPQGRSGAGPPLGSGEPMEVILFAPTAGENRDIQSFKIDEIQTVLVKSLQVNDKYLPGFSLSLMILNLELDSGDVLERVEAMGYDPTVYRVRGHIQTEPPFLLADKIDATMDIDTDITADRSVAAAMTALILQLVGKMPTAVGYQTWSERQIANLAAKIGVGSTALRELLPSLEVADAIYRLFSRSHLLRQALVNGARRYCADNQGVMVDCLNVGLGMLRNSGMTGLVLVDTYLVKPRHPALLVREVKSCARGLIAMYKRLQREDPLSAPYLKLTEREEDVPELNQREILGAIAVARFIGIRRQPTLRNYFPSVGTLVSTALAAKLTRLDDAYLGQSAELGTDAAEVSADV